MILGAALVAQNIYFGVIATVMVVSALKVVTTRNIVHAALYLVVVLAGVAALFVMSLAEFTASAQVLVYIGAVIVLFLFGIMLTQARIGREASVDHERRWVAGLTAAVLGGVMTWSLVDAWHATRLDALSPDPTNTLRNALQVQRTSEVSDAIFRDYLIPFEVVSVLLLAALIGAIVVARRD